MVQLTFGNGHQHCMQGGKGEQAVRKHGNDEMSTKCWRGRIGEDVFTWKERGQKTGDDAGGQHYCMQAIQPRVERFHPVEADCQPDHQR
ncbi:hypothetical protein SDC9_169042 [bioreactor metagenome]|uniref:Uncharacterized protein n=1 Tax=bioreactor metagenome TaxID=1076179 RepID=A0A645G6T0_9ZZZZ